MSKADKTLAKIMDGRRDENIDFADLCQMLLRFNYRMRQVGSHKVFDKVGFESINLQPSGHLAKGYQVRQVRASLKNGGI